MTNVEALKSLYVNFGGTASDVADIGTVSDMITALEGVASGGSGSFVAIECTVGSNENVLEKTFAEILAIAESGKVMGIVMNNGTNTRNAGFIIRVYTNGSVNQVYAILPNGNGNGIEVKVFTADSSDDKPSYSTVQ